MRYVGKRGTLEILPGGTVERELAERGERLYQLSDLPELLDEIRQGGAAGTAPRAVGNPGREEAPGPPPAPAAIDLASLFDDDEPAPLDFGPKARDDDPSTSHAAAEKILATRAGSQRWRLWGAFVEQGVGLTDEEACAFASVSLRSEYATRCSELRNAGIISVTGEERAGASGLMRDVSIITPLGLAEWGKRNTASV